MSTYQYGPVIHLIAGADLSAQEGRMVAVNSSGHAILATTATTLAIGVVHTPEALGLAVGVQIEGVARAVAGGTIAAGARVAPAAGGAVVTAAAGNISCGIALNAGASGQVIRVLLTPGTTVA